MGKCKKKKRFVRRKKRTFARSPYTIDTVHPVGKMSKRRRIGDVINQYNPLKSDGKILQY